MVPLCLNCKSAQITSNSAKNQNQKSKLGSSGPMKTVREMCPEMCRILKEYQSTADRSADQTLRI